MWKIWWHIQKTLFLIIWSSRCHCDFSNRKRLHIFYKILINAVVTWDCSHLTEPSGKNKNGIIFFNNLFWSTVSKASTKSIKLVPVIKNFSFKVCQATVFFFFLRFHSRTLTIHWTAREVRDYFFNYSYHVYPLHRHLDLGNHNRTWPILC